MSHNQMLCVSQSSVQPWLLFFEWDVQFSIIDDMACVQNSRGVVFENVELTRMMAVRTVIHVSIVELKIAF